MQFDHPHFYMAQDRDTLRSLAANGDRKAAAELKFRQRTDRVGNTSPDLLMQLAYERLAYAEKIRQAKLSQSARSARYVAHKARAMWRNMKFHTFEQAVARIQQGKVR